MSGDARERSGEQDEGDDPAGRDEGPDEVQLPPDDAAAGDPRVDAALRRAAELTNLPPAEHVAVYEDVHRTLQEVLADAAGSGAGQFRFGLYTEGDTER